MMKAECIAVNILMTAAVRMMGESLVQFKSYTSIVTETMLARCSLDR